jgi:hypothetical protein
VSLRRWPSDEVAAIAAVLRERWIGCYVDLTDWSGDLGGGMPFGGSGEVEAVHIRDGLLWLAFTTGDEYVLTRDSVITEVPVPDERGVVVRLRLPPETL